MAASAVQGGQARVLTPWMWEFLVEWKRTFLPVHTGSNTVSATVWNVHCSLSVPSTWLDSLNAIGWEQLDLQIVP